MPSSGDEHAVGDLAAYGADEPLREGIGPWATWRDLADGDAGVGQHGVDGGGELPGPIADEDLELAGAVAQVHEQVANLLNGPRPVRVGGDAEDVYVAAADLHHEEHVQAREGERAVHVEEVTRQQGLRLCSEELAPGGVVTALWCRWYAQPLRIRRIVEAPIR
jgi:hypothetical protein